MLIDFHTHIFPASISTRRERFFSNEPAFELLYASAKSKLVDAGQLIAQMDEHGVDKAVTFGFPWCSVDIAKQHNDYILEASAIYPDRLIGFCCVDPMQPEAPAEVARCLEAGMSGVGELAFYCSDFDCSDLGGMDEIMALALQFDCPLMLHTNEPVGHAYPGKTSNTLSQIYAFVKKHPANRLVLAHWGGGIFWYNLMKKEVAAVLRNVWFDTAASPYLYRPDIFRLAVELAGADKILLGTDYPLLSVSRYLDEMHQAGLTEEQQEMIGYRNALGLLRLQ
jgi:uncharacterized protein